MSIYTFGRTYRKARNRKPKTEYAMTKFTDLAIDWKNKQEKPWFLWLACKAPQSGHTIRDDTYKLLNLDNTTTRLYDVANEPYEANNLLRENGANTYSDIIKRLQSKIDEIRNLKNSSGKLRSFLSIIYYFPFLFSSIIHFT